MAPKKKGQKMALNEFLGDSALGSWADEMDSFPSAPSLKSDENARGDRMGLRGDSSLRGDRAQFPPREDLPLPTQPPYTAFVGNLAFDLTEPELEDFFAPSKTKSVKIIKDRDEKPKGFGYVEFDELDGLKDALSRSGTSMAGRTIRVSVAEPPKERSGFGGGGFDDDAKFAGNWRRDGPLPDAPSHETSRRRFDGPSGDRPAPPGAVSDTVDQWRSNRSSPRIPPADLESSAERRRSSFQPSSGLADTEEVWSKGSKFKPVEEGNGSRFSNLRRGDMPPPRDAPASVADIGDWRGSRPSRLNSTSPSGSTPPTPQMGRRKLELLPKSGSSAAPSPLSSPRMGPSTSGIGAPRSNPFGDAKPVDVSTKEKLATERIEKDREVVKERAPLPHSMSRTSSRAGSERTPSKPGSPRVSSSQTANVRPSISFANAAGPKKDSSEGAGEAVDQLKETTI